MALLRQRGVTAYRATRYIMMCREKGEGRIKVAWGETSMGKLRATVTRGTSHLLTGSRWVCISSCAAFPKIITACSIYTLISICNFPWGSLQCACVSTRQVESDHGGLWICGARKWRGEELLQVRVRWQGQPHWTNQQPGRVAWEPGTRQTVQVRPLKELAAGREKGAQVSCWRTCGVWGRLRVCVCARKRQCGINRPMGQLQGRMGL